MTRYLLFFCLCMLAFGQDQGSDLSLYRENLNRIKDEGLKRLGTYERLEALVREAPLRLSGSPGAAAAVVWAKQSMESAGLSNVRLEPVTVPHWVRGQVASLRVASPAYMAGTSLSILALGSSPPTPAGGIEADVVMVEHMDQLVQLGERARGKIVFINQPLNPTYLSTFRAYGEGGRQRSDGPALAAKLGALAAITRSLTLALDDVPHTGNTKFPDESVKIPAAAISTLGAERLAAEIKRGETVRLRLELDCRNLSPKQSYNVVGDLVGSEKPEEVLVVGGHLDAWDVGHGAHDCGAGTAQSIEVLSLLKDLGLRPKRTIRAVLFMNEENGIAGAKAYHAQHLEEMDRHVFAIESDSGGFTPRGIITNVADEAFAVLQEIHPLLQPLGVQFLWRGGSGADVGQLVASGVPAAGYISDSQRYFDLHHTHEDTLDKVNPRELELGTITLASLLYVLADLPQALPRLQIPPINHSH